jgi:hypothetical protein
MTNRTREKIRFCSELCIDLIPIMGLMMFGVVVVGAVVIGLVRLGVWVFTGN